MRIFGIWGLLDIKCLVLQSGFESIAVELEVLAAVAVGNSVVSEVKIASVHNEERTKIMIVSKRMNKPFKRIRLL